MTTMQSQQQSSVLNKSCSNLSEDDDESFSSYSEAVIASLLTKLCVCIDDDSENGEVPTEQLYDVECIMFDLYKCCNPFMLNGNDNMSSDECQLALINENGHTDIVTAMKQCMKSSIRVQQVGCRLLTASICGLQTDLKQVIITSNNDSVLNIILDTMKEYPFDVLVQSYACQFIANIVDVLHNEGTKGRFDTIVASMSNNFLSNVDSFDDIVLQNMHRFQSSQEMQWIGCLYFLNLSIILQKQYTAKRIEKLNHLKIQIADVVKRFPDNIRLHSFCFTTLQSIKTV
jgi:hypothetical protein